jgi:hypothetical protein
VPLRRSRLRASENFTEYPLYFVLAELTDQPFAHCGHLQSVNGIDKLHFFGAHSGHALEAPALERGQSLILR